MQRALGRAGSPWTKAIDGRAWLRLALAVIGLVALAVSGLIAAQEGRRISTEGPQQVVSTGRTVERWTNPEAKWRSRSQILEDAGVLQRR